MLWLILSATICGQATIEDNTSATSTDFLGWEDNTSFDLNIKHKGEFHINWFTFDEQRMRLTSEGWLGLNTLTPVALFHVEDGAVVFNGTTGDNPDYNAAGTRMMWIPEQGAFRGGTLTADVDAWDSGNVGDNSITATS